MIATSIGRTEMMRMDLRTWAPLIQLAVKVTLSSATVINCPGWSGSGLSMQCAAVITQLFLNNEPLHPVLKVTRPYFS